MVKKKGGGGEGIEYTGIVARKSTYVVVKDRL